MGHRAYIIKLNGNNTEALYSHWGANYLKKSLEKPLKRQMQYMKKGIFDKKVDAKQYFIRRLNKLIKYETEENKEKWETIKNIDKFLNLTMIDIETWVILNNSNIYVILPFISLELSGGIILKVTQDSYFNYWILKTYESFESTILIWSYSTNTITKEQIKKMLTSAFWKKYGTKHSNVVLVWEKIPFDVLNAIKKNVPFSVNHLVPILLY